MGRGAKRVLPTKKGTCSLKSKYKSKADKDLKSNHDKIVLSISNLAKVCTSKSKYLFDVLKCKTSTLSIRLVYD